MEPERYGTNSDNKQFEWIVEKQGVRQGCVLIPDFVLFLHPENYRRAERLGGSGSWRIKCNKCKISVRYCVGFGHLRFLARVNEWLNRSCVEKERKFNVGRGKPDVMKLTKRSEDLTVKITLDGSVVPNVEKYKYLRCVIEKDARSDI